MDRSTRSDQVTNSRSTVAQDCAAIELNEVSKAYQVGTQQVTVLHQVSLRIEPGEFVTVVGPSGSGKSTLLNMITGIDRPSSGQVTINGQSVHALSENQLARWRGRYVGIVFQFFQLLPALTILENVILPMDFCQVYRQRERRLRAMDLIEMVGIADHAHKLPNALSGGQQQRAAIARAMANDPPLIVADEPTGNLDTATAAMVLSLFQRLRAQDKTLFIVTHDPKLSMQAGRVIGLIDGRVYDGWDGGGTGVRPERLEAMGDSNGRSLAKNQA